MSNLRPRASHHAAASPSDANRVFAQATACRPPNRTERGSIVRLLVLPVGGLDEFELVAAATVGPEQRAPPRAHLLLQPRVNRRVVLLLVPAALVRRRRRDRRPRDLDAVLGRHLLLLGEPLQDRLEVAALLGERVRAAV